MKVDHTYVFSKNLNKLLGVIEDFILPTNPLPIYRFYINQKPTIQENQPINVNCNFDHLILELKIEKLTKEKEFVLVLTNDEDYAKLLQVDGFKLI